MPTLPTSVLFDVFDWGPAGVGVKQVGDDDDGMLVFAETSRGTPFARSDFVGDDDRLEVFSADGEATELKFQYNIVNSYTLETEIRFPGLALPTFGAGLQNPNEKHIFIAAADKQDNAAGVLFTDEGISVVAYPNNVTVPITGTASLIPMDEDELITVRIAVDGHLDIVDLYVTKSADLAAGKPHNLVGTLRASQSLGLNFDGAYISVKGIAEDPSRVGLRSFRLASRVVAPHSRPIANAGRDLFYPLSGSVQLDGSQSSDPDGGILTYKWTIASSPAGSDPTLTGSTKASKSITNAAGGDGLTLTAVRGGQASNLISVTIAAADAANGALTLAASGNDITITLASDANNAVSSRYVDVYEALTNQNNPSYDASVAALVTATRDEAFQAVEDLVEALAKTFLIGGTDSTISNPVFRTDTLGTYQIDLITNNGFLDSISASVLVVAHQTMQPLGYIPDASYIWNSLPDFWKLVPDKEPFATYWSTVLQTISGEMLKAWQVDYSKALVDVPKQFARKWINFDPFLEDTERVVYKVQVSNPGTRQEKRESVAIDKAWLHLPGRTPEFKTGDAPNSSVHVLEGAAGMSVLKEQRPFALTTDTFTDAAISVESYSNITPRKQVGGVPYSGDIIVNTSTGDSYEVKCVDSAKKAVTLVTDNLPLYTVIDSGTLNGKVVDDGDNDLDSNLWGLIHGRLKTSAIQAGADKDDLWITKSDGTQEKYDITAIDPELGTVTLNQELRISEYSALTWKIVRRASAFSWKIAPHIESDLDLVKDEMVKKGDLARFRVTTTTTTLGGVSTTKTSTTHSEILSVLDSYWEATSGKSAPLAKVVFDPGDATAGTGLLGTITNFDGLVIAEDGTQTTNRLEYLGILRLSSMPVDKTVSSIPNLRYPISTPTSAVDDTNSLKENLHYNVLAPSGSSTYGSVSFKDVFSSTVLPPDQLWAELVYTDNKETLENNFGKWAGYTAEEIDAAGLDYLSVLQALWYSYFGGPSVSNMRLGCQALFGLPFTEKAGTVVSIDPEYSLTHGRIVVQDKDDEDVQRSYTYPLVVGTEVTATQDIVYNTTLKNAVGSGAGSIVVVSTAGFEPGQTLSIGPAGSLEKHKIRTVDHSTGKVGLSMPVVGDYQAVTAVEARTVGAATELEAFTPLSKGVTIEDYIKAPRWWVYRVLDGQMTEVEKYFTFKVTLEGSLANSSENFDMVVKFIKQIKPVYTTPVFAAGLFLDGDDGDQVSVSDQMYALPARLFLYDNPRGGPDINFGNNAEANRTETIGHPTAAMLDSYDGKGSIVTNLDRADAAYGQRVPYAGDGQTQSDMDIRADRSSPKYDFNFTATGDPKGCLDTAVTIPSEYFSAEFNASDADGTPSAYYVVIQGTIQDDGVYKIDPAYDSAVGMAAAPAYITLKTLADQNPTPLANDVGRFYLIDNKDSTTQTVAYDAGTGKWSETAASKGRLFDPGINEPKVTFDNNVVPFYRTVNQRVKINLELQVGGVDQVGPRVDQGLIVDDFLTMDVNNPAKVPNMHNTSTPSDGGNGLFWWFDAGAVGQTQEQVAAAQNLQGFYTNYTTVDGVYRPSGSAVDTGYVERVVGHKGLSLPPKDPNIFIDASPRNQSVNE